ncbi:MAG: CBS domain-containing protein [Deltaproteobacteria bacterium]|nr:CBS domain-containing protein [Deltaproteobacteria bacterium]
MKVRDILHTKGATVITTTPDATLHDALRTLVDSRVVTLVVIDPAGKVVGIITERDLLRVCAELNGEIDRLRVADWMTTHLIIGVPRDEVGYIMGIMTHNRIRHSPIMDDGRLEGIISIGDVVKAQLEETEFENRYLKDYIQRQ